jgi:hypothetical protein
VAVVRHPLYRAVSLYHYCRKLTGHRLYELAMNTTLEEFYPQASRANPAYFRNTQCLRVGGCADARRAQETILERYLGYGFAQDVESFGRVLGEALDWPEIPRCKRALDESRYDIQITPRFRDQVLGESAEDLKLYEWAASGAPALPKRKSFLSMFGKTSG